MVEHDEALNRLRASDPATGSHPDLHTLRRRIGQKAPASQADTATALRDEMFAGPAVRAPWVAAAAVLALGFGAGGYAIGAQGPSGGTLAAGPSEESSSDADEGGADEGGADEGGEDSALRDLERSVSGPDSASATMVAGESAADSGAGYAGGDGQAWDPGPVRLVAGAGLPTDHPTGEVRALMSDEDPDAFLAAWAERLSFEGLRPQDSADENWFGGDVIYDPDGVRILSAGLEGTGGALNFSYSDMLADPYCVEMYSQMPESEMDQMRKEFTDAFGEDVELPDSSRCKDTSGPAPSAEDAIEQARDFLATTGLDVSAYELQVPDYQDDTVNQVLVEGWPEGSFRNGQLNVTVNVGPQGVTNAYGMVGEMRSLGDYALISATEAVERYGQREFGMEYGITLDEDAGSWAADATTMPVEPDLELPEPSPVEPGMKIPMLLKEKVVTGAELTRGTIWPNTGGPLEVPAWKLTTEDGMHYAVLALADESIDWQSWGD